MGIIIKLGNYKNILELGTYLGYSTLGMSSATSGTITTIDKDDRFIKKAHIFWAKSNVNHKIKFIRGIAIDEMEKLTLNSFDMIFIDADKTNNYFEISLISIGDGMMLCKKKNLK